jgi:cell division septation protein DedD
MAEYYPLLARAVAGLKTSTPQARRLIYERARNALLAQLRAMTPPVPEPDIQRESDALDAAIARLETEFDAAAPAQDAIDPLAAEQARERAAQEKAAQEKAAQEKAAQEKAAQEKADRARAEQAALEEAEAQARRAAAAREEQRLATERAQRERVEAEARRAAQERVRLEAEAAAVVPTAPVAPNLANPGLTASAAAQLAPANPSPLNPAPASQTPAKPAPASPAPAKPAPAKPAPAKSAPAKPAPPADSLSPFGVAPEIRVDRDGATGDGAPVVAPQRHDAPEPKGAFPSFTAERAGGVGGASEAEDGAERARAARPAAPLPPPERRSNLRYILAGGGLALVIGGLAYAAWVLRDRPQETARPNVAQESKPAESGKIADRIGVSPSSPVPTVQAPAESIRPNADKPADAPAAPAPTSADVAAPARAAFLIQSEGPEQHKTYAGTVTWRFADGVWRADVSAPEVKLAMSFAMSKATDDGPASHKIDLRFQSEDPTLQIARAGVPEMRKEENPYGDRLAAVAVQVTPSVYLVGLRKAEADVAYNLELIKARGWIDVPLEMSDKRIAKITFEKGPAGDATLAQALKAWGAGG